MGSFVKFSVLYLLLVVMVISGGCAGNISRGKGHMFSFVSESCPVEQAGLLADRMADSLIEFFPPGHTSIFIQPASGKDALGPAFDQALRSRGFVIVPEPSDQVLSIAYALDQVDEQTWYTRLAVSGGLVITRTYFLSGDQLTEGAAAMKAGGDHGQR